MGYTLCSTFVGVIWILTSLASTVRSAGIDISKDIEQITSGVPFTPSKASEILVPEQEVRFFLSTKQKKNVTISKSNIEPVEASKPVKVIIHGWTENASYHGNDYYKRITDAYLEKSDFNIITVDWDKPAHKNYITSSASTQGVGRHVGNLLEKIHTEKKVELKDIHIIGHSLGAHVAGFAAKRVTQLARSKIWQVTGLDPAGPLFETPPEPKQNRLSDTDASIVEVVHTDGGVFGFLTPLGTVDFYPNGGVPTQPNCNPLDNAFCSHHYSYEIYIKAIKQGGIESTQCATWTVYRSGSCKSNKKLKIAGNLQPADKGVYYAKIVV